jgi:high-affinity nickel-transport protein
MDTAGIPDDLLSLALLALLLGIRHGFDADHLAAIDGLTRFNQQTRPKLARIAGCLFSVGHGLIILPVSVFAAIFSKSFSVPEWLNGFGTWMSIIILLSLACLNIFSALNTARDEIVTIKGLRGSWISRLVNISNPFAMLAVGALFAFSFDTLSQAALFAVISNKFQMWQIALGMALLFVIGMLATDGLNGFFISYLTQRSDQTAKIASRVMALSVSGVSILVAVVSIASETSTSFDAWREGKEMWLGVIVMLTLILSYFLGQRLSKPHFVQ